MKICPNVNTPVFQDTVKAIGDNAAYALFEKMNYEMVDKHPSYNYYIEKYGVIDGIKQLQLDTFIPNAANNVQYQLKAIELLNSTKAIQVFEKGNKVGWDLNKILTELQVPKEQKQLILSKNITDREAIITSLLAENSFVVEVNTTLDKGKDYVETIDEEGNYDVGPFIPNTETELIEDEEGNVIGTREVLTETGRKQLQERETNNPSQVYSHLTVPGGTNYTENEISTPAITPSIKGHAQFSTENGIGWFRSDEKSKIENTGDVRTGVNYLGEPITFDTGREVGTKTRRILEVQSDLFQKGRDKEFLSNNPYITDEELAELNSRNLSKEEYGKEFNKIADKSSNQFLQLLNKDNNWVTFFVKSIIQDSAKKGYKKILFPTGNTASKIEGHTTLEEFKKQTEDRIKKLEKTKTENTLRPVPEEINFNEPQINLSVDQEINQLKQELERVETEGFAALKPIWNFYENTVTNILNKNYKSRTTQITDEYNNTWNEVTVDKTDTQKISFATVVDKSLSWNVLKDLPVYSEEGINTMNTTAAAPNEHFGNPFTANEKLTKGNSPLILMPDVASAVQAYENWLLKPSDINPAQKEWIWYQINEGRIANADLLYMNDKGDYYSHADALAKIVDNFNNTSEPLSVRSLPEFKKREQLLQQYEELNLIQETGEFIILDYITGIKFSNTKNEATDANIFWKSKNGRSIEAIAGDILDEAATLGLPAEYQDAQTIRNTIISLIERTSKQNLERITGLTDYRKTYASIRNEIIKLNDYIDKYKRLEGLDIQFTPKTETGKVEQPDLHLNVRSKNLENLVSSKIPFDSVDISLTAEESFQVLNSAGYIYATIITKFNEKNEKIKQYNKNLPKEQRLPLIEVTKELIKKNVIAYINKKKATANSDQIVLLDKWEQLLNIENSSLWTNIKINSNERYGKEPQVNDLIEEGEHHIKDFDDNKRFGQSVQKNNDLLKRYVNEVKQLDGSESLTGFPIFLNFERVNQALIKFLNVKGKILTKQMVLDNLVSLAELDPKFKYLQETLDNSESSTAKESDKILTTLLVNFVNKAILDANVALTNSDEEGKLSKVKIDLENKAQHPYIAMTNLMMNNFKKVLDTRELKTDKSKQLIESLKNRYLKSQINLLETTNVLVDLFSELGITLPIELIERYVKYNRLAENNTLQPFLAELYTAFNVLHNYAITHEILDPNNRYDNSGRSYSQLNYITTLLTSVDTDMSEMMYPDLTGNLRSAVVNDFPLLQFFDILRGPDGLAFLEESMKEEGITFSNWLKSGNLLLPADGASSIVRDENNVLHNYKINKQVVDSMYARLVGGIKNKDTGFATTDAEYNLKDVRIINLIKYHETKLESFRKRRDTTTAVIGLNTPSEGANFDLSVPITLLPENFYTDIAGIKFEGSNDYLIEPKLMQEVLKPIVGEQQQDHPLLTAYMKVFLQEIIRIGNANDEHRDFFYLSAAERAEQIKSKKMQLYYDYTYEKGTNNIIQGNRFQFNSLPFLNDIILDIFKTLDVNIEDFILPQGNTEAYGKVEQAVLNYIDTQNQRYINEFKSIYKDVSNIFNEDINAFNTTVLEYAHNYFLTQNEMGNFVTGKIGEYKTLVDVIKRNKKTQTIGEKYLLNTPDDSYLTINFNDINLDSEVFEGVDFDKTDAQSVITIKGYKEKLQKRGAYNGKLKEAIEALERGEQVTTPLRQLKNFYSSYDFDNDVNRRVSKQDKNSEVLIHKSFFPGSPITTLIAFIEELEESLGTTIQINFNSGQKHGSFGVTNLTDSNKNLRITKNADGTFEIDKDLKEEIKNNLDVRYYRNLREQLTLPQEELDHHITAGKQIDKVVLTNLSDNPIYDYNGTKLTGFEIIQEIYKLRTANIEDDFNRTVDRFTDENGVVTEESLSQFLTAFGEGQEWNGNMLKAISVDNTNDRKQMYMHLSFSSLNSKAQEAITAKFTKNVLKQTISGTHLYQAANLFLDEYLDGNKDNVSTESSIDATTYNNITWVNGKPEKLTFTTLDGQNTAIAKVLLPAVKAKHIKPDGTIDIENIDKESLTMLGYRIPTEGKYSTIVFEVVGFLPPALGTSVVLPDDWVAQSGSDFDIDSLYIMNYNIDSDGKVIKYLNDDNSTLKERFLLNGRKFSRSNYSEGLKALIENVRKNKDSLEFTRQFLVDTVNEMFVDAEVTTFEEALTKLNTEKEKIHIQRINNNQRIADTDVYLEKEAIKRENNELSEIMDDLKDVSKLYHNDTDVQNKRQSFKISANEEKEFNSEEFKRFSKLSIQEQNTRQARENSIIDAYISILSNPESHAEIKERSQFKDITDARDTVHRLTGQGKEVRHPYDLIDQEEVANLLRSGGTLKGIFVNLDSVTSIANTVGGITLNKPITIKLTAKQIEEYGVANLIKLHGENFNAEDRTLKLTTLGRTSEGSVKNAAGKNITTFGAQTTANSLDIAKEAMLKGINPNTATIFKLLPMLGHSDYLYGSLLFEQHIIKRFIALDKDENGHFATNEYVFNNLYGSILLDIDNLKNQKAINETGQPLSDEPITSVYVNEEKIAKTKLKYNEVPDINDLAKYVTINDNNFPGLSLNDKITYLEKQLSYLNLFHDMSIIAKQVDSLSKALSYDKLGAGPQLNTTPNQNEKVEEANKAFTVRGTSIKEAFFGENSVYDVLKSFKVHVNDKVYDMFSPFFITETPALNALASQINDTEKQAEFKTYAVRSFLSGGLGNETFFGSLEDNITEQRRILGIKTDTVTDLDLRIVTDETYNAFQKLSAANKLDLIKKFVNKNINSDSLINALTHKPETNVPYSYIELDLSVDDDVLVEDFKNLINSDNIFIKDFIFDLIAYDYLTKGLQWGSGIAKLIPIEVFKQRNTYVGNLDLDSSLRAAHTQLKNNTLYTLNDLYYSFLRTKHKDNKLVPPITKRFADKLFTFNSETNSYTSVPLLESQMSRAMQNSSIVKYFEKVQIEDTSKIVTHLYQKQPSDMVDDEGNSYFTFEEVNKLEAFEVGDISYNEANNVAPKTSYASITDVQHQQDFTARILEVFKPQLTEIALSRTLGETEDFAADFFFSTTREDIDKLSKYQLIHGLIGLSKNPDIKLLLEDDLQGENLFKLDIDNLRVLAFKYANMETRVDFSLDHLPTYKKVEDLNIEEIHNTLKHIYIYNLKKINYYKEYLKDYDITDETVNNSTQLKQAAELLASLTRFVKSFHDFDNLYYYKEENIARSGLSPEQIKTNKLILEIRSYADTIQDLETLSSTLKTKLYTKIVQKNTTDKTLLENTDNEAIIFNAINNLFDVSLVTRELDTAFDSTQTLISNLLKEVRVNMSEAAQTAIDLKREWKKVSSMIDDYTDIIETTEIKKADGTKETILTGKIDLKKVKDKYGREAHLFFAQMQAYASAVNPQGLVAQGYLPAVPDLKRSFVKDTVVKGFLAFYDDLSLDNHYDTLDRFNTRYIDTHLPYDSSVTERRVIIIPEPDVALNEDFESLSYEKRALEEISITQNKYFNSLKEVRAYNSKVGEFNKSLKGATHGQNISYNLDEIIPTFIDKLIEIKAKKDNVDLVRLLITDIKTKTEPIKRRKFDKSKNKVIEFISKDTGTGVVGAESNLIKQLEWVLDNTFYGESNRSSNEATKWGRALRKYTALRGMAFNVFSGINNAAYGRVQTRIKAMAGDEFGNEDWNFSYGYYYTGTKDSNLAPIMSYITDTTLTDGSATTIQSALIKKFNILFHQNELPETGRKNVQEQQKNNKFKSVVAKNSSFQFLNNIGEHGLQNRLLFAMLNSHRIINGVPTSFAKYLESIEIKNTGKTAEEKKVINLKNKKAIEQAKLDFKALPKLLDIFKLSDDGYLIYDTDKVSERELAIFREKVIRKNHQLHGIYNQDDLALIQSTEMGRLIMMFRKWLRPGWNKRFGSIFLKDAGYNELSQTQDKGTYTSLYNFFGSELRKNALSSKIEQHQYFSAARILGADMASFVTNIRTHYRSLSFSERRRAAEALSEISAFIISSGILMFVLSLDDDDKKKNKLSKHKSWLLRKGYNMSVYQLDRLNLELKSFLPVVGWFNEGAKLLASPSANFNSIFDMYSFASHTTRLLNGIDDTDVYRGGIYKGQLKAKVKLYKVIPILNQFKRFEDLEKTNKAFNLIH